MSDRIRDKTAEVVKISWRSIHKHIPDVSNEMYIGLERATLGHFSDNIEQALRDERKHTILECADRLEKMSKCNDLVWAVKQLNEMNYSTGPDGEIEGTCVECGHGDKHRETCLIGNVLNALKELENGSP